MSDNSNLNQTLSIGDTESVLMIVAEPGDHASSIADSAIGRSSIVTGTTAGVTFLVM